MTSWRTITPTSSGEWAGLEGGALAGGRSTRVLVLTERALPFWRRTLDSLQAMRGPGG